MCARKEVDGGGCGRMILKEEAFSMGVHARWTHRRDERQ